MLETDREEGVSQAMRPIILDGSPNLTDRRDRASNRAGVLGRRVDRRAARPRRSPRRLLDRLAPSSVGKLDRAPRMADFAEFAVAFEPGSGFEPGWFPAARAANRADTTETTSEPIPPLKTH